MKDKLKSILSALTLAEHTNKKLAKVINQKNMELLRLQMTIRDLNNTVMDLRTNPPISPIQIWNILESILDHDKSFHFPQPVSMRVQNLNDEHRSIVKEINPRDVICITALEGDKRELRGNQRRKKLIFYKEETTKSGWVYRCYLVNNDKSFTELCDAIDNLSWYLCVVNKNTIVGVHYYDLTGNTLTLNENCDLAGIKKTVEISKDLEVKKFPAKDVFVRVKTYHFNRVLFQKKAIGYKEDMGL